MTKQWEQYKEEICRLYTSGLTIEILRQHMVDTYGFEASPSSYRHILPAWGVFKRSSRRPESPSSAFSRDSGYATDSLRGSWSTSASTSSDRSSSVGYTAPHIPPIPRRNAASLAHNRSRSTLSRVTTHDNGGNIDTFSSLDRTQGRCVLSSGIAKGHGLVRTAEGRDSAQAGADSRATRPYQDSQRDTKKPSKPLPPLPNGYYPPHAPPSRCRLAFTATNGSLAELERCPYCGTSRAHHLAAVANTINSAENLIEHLRTEQLGINGTDVFGNTPLHFLAGNSPSWDQIKVFYHCGANLAARNATGETFLHVLDPEVIGTKLADLLQWAINKGFDLKQRTYDGDTVLHRLSKRIASLDIVISILPIFQSVRNNINARNNRGLSVVNSLFGNWFERRKIGKVRDEEWAGLIRLLQFYVPGLDLVNLHIVHNCPSSQLLGWKTTFDGTSVEHPQLRQPSEHFETVEDLQSRDLELLSVVHRASTDALAQDGRGRNSLNCLAYINRLLPCYRGPQSSATRLQYIKNCLECGVDPNDFDSRGSTPLHSFLSKPLSNEDEPSTASLLEALMEGGADVNAQDRDGDTPLSLACRAGLLPCTEVILRHQPNLRGRNYRGRGIIEEAEYWMSENDVQCNVRIQLCIDRIRQAGPVDHPIDNENLAATDALVGSPRY